MIVPTSIVATTDHKKRTIRRGRSALIKNIVLVLCTIPLFLWNVDQVFVVDLHSLVLLDF